MKRARRFRFLLWSATVPLVLLGTLTWFTYLSVRREDATAQLFDAVKQGNVRKVLELLRWGADPNVRETDPSVHRGFASHFLSLLRSLVGKRKQVPTTNGTPVLEQAADGGHAEIVKALLQKGADPNARDEFDQTALFWAVEYPDIVRELLEHKADVEVKDPDGATPLIVAAHIGNTATVKLLLERGANVNAEESGSTTALWKALTEGHAETATFLLDHGATFDPHSKEAESLLLDSVYHVACVRLLPDRGVSVNAANEIGYNALMYSIDPNCIKTMRLLITRGADVNARDESGSSVLKNAYDQRDRMQLKGMGAEEKAAFTEIIRLLKEAGARE